MKKKLVSLISFALALVMAMTSLLVGTVWAVSTEDGETATVKATIENDSSVYTEPYADAADASFGLRTYSRTMDEVRAWLDNEAAMQNQYNNGQCTWFCKHYLVDFWGENGIYGVGNANGWVGHCPPNWQNVNVGGNPDNFRMGDLIVEVFNPNGHVMVYYGKGSDGRHYVVDSNFNGHLYTTKHIWYTPLANATYCYRPPITTAVLGSEMTSGYERVLPDGNYIIANAGSTNLSEFCYLDIMGADYPAANGTNVTLWNAVNPTYVDAWKLTYNDGFYTITQMGTDRALEVTDSSRAEGANVQIWTNHARSKWAISKNGQNGYRIQAKCSGFSLDVSGGGTANGTNVQQWQNNDTDAQSWLFIPFEPSQPIQNGRYILLSGIADGWELDVEGNTGNFEGTANVQLWDDMADSRYNSFDITKLENGYYSIIHAASGKSLDIANGLSTYHNNIVVTSVNGCNAQQWAITPNGNGYVLRARCSGMTLDVYGGVAENGRNISSYPYNGSPAQTWRFVPAEYTVSYNANGGYGAPPSQIKYYKGNLTLSQSIPTRSGYIFRGWAATSSAQSPAYQPGGIYTADSDITLYAVWQTSTHTVTFVNGHTSEIMAVVTVAHGSAASAPEAPEYDWYVFSGWDIDFSNVTSDLIVTAQYAEKGDMDGNGFVTIADALLLMRHSLGLIVLDNSQYADINGDGSISVLDALLVLRHAIGLI